MTDRLRNRWRRTLAGAAAVVAAGALTTAPAASAAEVPDAFTIAGSGYGHGVGMAQYGAYQLAREGASAVRILKHYYRGGDVLYKTTPKYIAVQVHGPEPYGFAGYGDTARTTTVTVTGGQWRLRTTDARTLVSGSGTGRLTVTTEDGRVKVTVGDRTFRARTLRIAWSGTEHWRPTGAKAVATVKGAHGSYRNGRLELTASRGIPNIVNEVRFNTEYLYGIAEMPSSWGLSGGDRALRAQAMTARSYALTKPTRNTLCNCNVVDDVRDQYYSGWKKENEGTGGRYGALWKAAVNATVQSTTVGRVLTYRGAPVTAHYYSSSGGRTANSEEVWASVVPYERSVADPYSLTAPGNGYRSWTRTLSQAQARTLFGLPDVVSVRVTARWTSGQARTLTATASDGTTAVVTGKADQVRSAVGRRTTAGSMPAAWITSIRAAA